MKKINKIIAVIGLFICVWQPTAAQIRMGLDWSCGITESKTDEHGYDYNRIPTVHAGLSFEYILPRRVMPYYLPLSIKSGICYSHYEEFFEDGESVSSWSSDSMWGHGVGVPLTAEIKYLINNHIRVYANGGVIFNVLFIDNPYYDFYDDNDEVFCKFKIAGTVEAGIEFRNFRVGFGYRKLFSTFYGWDKEGEKKPGGAFVSMGWRFGGNRLFKKTSKLSIY